jgi:putative N6-adenine-specific DNA methylase
MPAASARPVQSDTPLQFFSPCPRGLEGVLSAELAELGAQSIESAEGGVAFAGDLALCYRANLHSRIASRVLWKLGDWAYRSEDDVYRASKSLPWAKRFDSRLTLKINVSAIGSPLRSLDFITLRIKDAVCDRLLADTGRRPDIDTAQPDVRVHAFFEAERFTLYLDTSGEPLFKRGWRKSAGEAPLKENLAAGILRLTNWQPQTALLDPMCGAGTLLVEAAMIALRIAPGSMRAFAFEKLAGFDAALWDSIKTQASEAREPVRELAIYGADLYGEQLKLARSNLSQLGLADVVTLKQANVLELPRPAPAGVLVTNPPYGVRIGEQQELASLYPKLGDALKAKYAGWSAWVFTADMRLPKLIGLKPSRRIPLYNGALECRLYGFEIVAGSMRGKGKETTREAND